jgi:hypothetical protein
MWVVKRKIVGTMTRFLYILRLTYLKVKHQWLHQTLLLESMRGQREAFDTFAAGRRRPAAVLRVWPDPKAQTAGSHGGPYGNSEAIR